MRRFKLSLTADEQRELRHLRSYHAKAYVRERAAAILQIASGKTVGEVARKGLMRRRDDETVSAWVRRYVDEGAKGLEVRAGRGRKLGSALQRSRIVLDAHEAKQKGRR